MHFYDSFNDIHELKYGQAEEKLEAGGDEKLIFNFIWPKFAFRSVNSNSSTTIKCNGTIGFLFQQN